jgi:hypothetical protein
MREARARAQRQRQQIWLGEAECSSRSSCDVDVVGRRTRANVLRLSPAPPASSTSSPAGAPHGPRCGTHRTAMRRVLGGRGVVTSRVMWQVDTLRCRGQSRPGPPAVLGEVSEAATAQTMSWQPTSHYSVRVGETVETSVVELCRDLPSLCAQTWVTARLNRDGHRSPATRGSHATHRC